jgi:ubiquinone/menaquinone biosynthesis C-methylase UbiE
MNVSGPEAAARNYVEQRDVRAYLTRINPPSGGAGCEVGAGFGRVTVVLEEFYDDVVAFERERALVETGASLHPTIRFVQVDSLAELPSNDASFDVALIYTVLQHLTDPEVVATLDEITRVLKPDGSLILCEHIDPDYSTGALRRGAIFTIGRAADHYARLLRDFDLVDTSPRHTQTWSDPGDQGHYMWFRKK